jgi:hypothetical protein
VRGLHHCIIDHWPLIITMSLPLTPEQNMTDTSRQSWLAHLTNLATPILTNLANETLRQNMPVECKPDRDRRNCSHLEAFGRLMAGISPWLESNSNEPRRAELADLDQKSLHNAVNPNCKDFMNWTDDFQPLVDAAFLAHAILRAPNLLWHNLPRPTQKNLVNAMLSTRRITPGPSNWLLFSAMVEAFLALAGESYDAMRIDYAVRQHMQWYKGDGIYGDGKDFHWDYYNSFVIQPMLLDVLAEGKKHNNRWNEFLDPIEQRAQRYAVIQERLIAPDGAFPVVGRSIAYRCGAFQHLAHMALRQALPPELPPAQAKTALSQVIHKTLSAPNTYDKNGWLQIGLAGHQPNLGEGYISTGSLYLCSVALLPLGLPPQDPFWKDPAQPTTSQRIWSGQDAPADHAIAL